MNKKIIVNGVEHNWHPEIIMIDEVGKLAYENSEWYKKMLKKNPLQIKPYLRTMSCSYQKANPESGKTDGILGVGEIVRIQDGTEFNMADEKSEPKKIIISVKQWNIKDVYECPHCGNKLKYPDYTCEKDNIKIQPVINF